MSAHGNHVENSIWGRAILMAGAILTIGIVAFAALGLGVGGIKHDAYDEARARKDYVETYQSQFDFGTDINGKIDAYLVGITSYMNANPPYKTWKYTTKPTPPAIPKMPSEIMTAFKNLPMPHKYSLGGSGKLNFPGESAEG